VYPEGPRWGAAYEAPVAKKDPLKPLRENAAKIAIVVAIAVALYWYFFLNPKPASLSVSVAELDGSARLDGELRVSVAGVTKTATVDGGRAELRGLPTGKAMLLFTPSDDKKYKQAEASVTLSSGAEGSASIEVPLNAELELSLPYAEINAGRGCNMPIRASLKNSGSTAFDAALIVDGDIKGWVKAGNKTVGAGKTEFLDVIVAVPSSVKDSEAKSGKLRVKGTNEEADITITPAEKPVLSFETTDLRIDASTGEKKTSQMSVKNDGDSDLRGITARASGDISDWLSITLPNEIKAGGSATMVVRAQVPADAEAKEYAGTVDITTPCDTIPITVAINVQSPTSAGVLEVSPDRLSFEILPGKFAKNEISLKAMRNADVQLSIVGDDVLGWVTLSKSKISLDAGESYTVFVTANIPDDVAVGDYRGLIEVEYAGGPKFNIPVAITVQSD
jgi:hypothetical protein